MGSYTAERDRLRLATEFWAEMRGSALLGAILAARMMESAASFEDEEGEQFREDVDAIIAGMGYGLSLADLQSLRDTVRDGQIGYWQDVYLLRADDGEVWQLIVEEDGASCIVDGAKLVLSGFRERKLVLEEDGGQVSMAIDFHENDPDPAQPDRPSGIAYCKGSLLRKDGTSVAIVGKEDCYFPASIDWDHRGDPLASWAGSYALYDIDTGAAAEDLAIGWDGTVTYAAEPLTVTIWSDNKLIAAKPDKTQVKAQFSTSLCYVAVEYGRLWRRYVARRRPDTPAIPAATAAAHPNRMVRPAAIAAEAAQGSYPDEPYVFSIPSGTTKIDLPEGVEKHPYRVQLNYDGAAISECALDGTVAPYTDTLRISATGLVRGVFGETQHASFHEFALTFKDKGQVRRRVEFTLPVSSRRDLGLSPDELKPLIKGVEYSQRISADGYAGDVYWKIDPALDEGTTGLKTVPAAQDDQNTFQARYITVEGTPKGGLLSTTSLTVSVWPDPAKTIQTPTVKTYSLDVADNLAFSRTEGVFGIVATLLALGEIGIAIFVLKRDSKPSDVDRLSEKLEKIIEKPVKLKELNDQAIELKDMAEGIQTDIELARDRRDELQVKQLDLEGEISKLKAEVERLKDEVDRAEAQGKLDSKEKEKKDVDKKAKDVERQGHEKKKKKKEEHRTSGNG